MVIATGDIVQEEPVKEHWIYLQSLLPRLEVPSFLLPGNHDHAGGGGKIYQKYGGLLNYSVVMGDFFFLAMDSDLEGEDWLNQLKWVESELQKHSDKVIIMAWHHPLFSSEYHEISGSVNGGYIYGSWENSTDLAQYMHYQWLHDDAPSSAATKVLRIVEEYDVRVILAGHVHLDIIYILNDRHHFITVGPVGGGLPPKVYHGSRLVTVDTDGNVSLDWYGDTRMLDPPNAIPVYGLQYWYSSENDWSENSVTATIMNDLEMPLENARLEFHVSSSNPVEAYEFTVAPNRHEVYTTEEGHIFAAYYDVPAGGSLDVTLSSVEDTTDPKVSLTHSDYTPGSQLSGTITVTDSDWGVERVEAYYTNTALGTWKPFTLSFIPEISGDVYDITYPEYTYSYLVSPGDAQNGLSIKVDAWDYAGNQYTYQSPDLSIPPTYTLDIDTNPTGIPVTVNRSSKSTPYTAEVEEGTITISVPEEAALSGKTYTFQGWADGGASEERTVTVGEDVSYMANYVEKEEPPGGIPMPTEFALAGLAVVLFLLSRRR
jgi:hypothetical protein